jgi:sugar lactone lactonase YvrE
MKSPPRRAWLTAGASFIILAVAVCLRGEPALGRGIGDGGLATNATLLAPIGLALDAKHLYIVESVGRRVRRVDLTTGIITTIAGGGFQCVSKDSAPPKPGCFDYPQRVTVDSLGHVYVTDDDVGVIEVGATPDKLSTIVPASIDQALDRLTDEKRVIESPAGIAADLSGGLFFDDHTEHTVYHVTLRDNSYEIIAGTRKVGLKGNGGASRDAEFRFPNGLALDKRGNLYIADERNCRIQQIDSNTGIVTTVIGTEESGLTCERLADGGGTSNGVMDVAVDADGGVFFVQEFRYRVQRFDPLTGSITTVAGNGELGFGGDHGPAIKARLHNPQGVAVDKNGNLYISDTSNNRVRRVDKKTGVITTVAGKGPESPDLQM